MADGTVDGVSDAVPKDELEATLAVRQEKGAEIEPALVDSLAAKIEAEVRRRYQAELERHRPPTSSNVAPGARVAVCIVSIVMAIPLTAIAGSMLGFYGVGAVWVGLVLLNFALRPNSDD